MNRYSFENPTPNEGDSDFPEEEATLAAALGKTVLWFEELDDQISTAVSFLLRRGDDVGRIITCELSFRAKVNLFEVLFRKEQPGSEHLSSLRDLCAACLQTEQRRNQVIHSNWRPDLDGLGIVRRKYTARGKHGLREQAEKLSLNQVSAVWEHCGFLAHSVDELMFWEFNTEYGTMEDPPEVRATYEHSSRNYGFDK